MSVDIFAAMIIRGKEERIVKQRKNAQRKTPSHCGLNLGLLAYEAIAKPFPRCLPLEPISVEDKYSILVIYYLII